MKGINVTLYRFCAVLFGGMMAGLAGAFITLASVGIFVADITSGRGWLAIAIVIFGDWKPTKILWASLFFGFKMVLEEYENNPFLEDFYNDPERFAFQTQLFFLMNRYRQQQDLRQVDMFHNLLITDYMFVKDRLFASLNLNDKELSLYDTVANLLERNVLKPDLVIFLQAETQTLMRNISGRGREFEANMSFDYLDALSQVYNEYFFKYSDTPLIIINTNNISL